MTYQSFKVVGHHGVEKMSELSLTRTHADSLRLGLCVSDIVDVVVSPQI